MYYAHENEELKNAFKEKPFQGTHPKEAKFIFFGEDANFDKKIGDDENKHALQEVLKYLENGPLYWKETGKHHAFLSEKYTGDGKQYHKRFSKIGFKNNHAQDVSFVELLDFPTFGVSKLEFSDLNDNHINNIVEWVFTGESKYIFIPDCVARLLKKRTEFKLLRKKKSELELKKSIPLWGTVGNKDFFKNRHLTYITYSQCGHIGSLI